MGFVPHMFFLTILMFLSFQSTHILVVDGSLIAAAYFNGERREIEKVSGGDEREDKEPLILEKVRFLLGLKSSFRKTQLNGEIEAPAPSPTIEAPSPAPAPVHPTQVHPHRSFHGSNPIPRPKKIQNEKRDNKGRFKRITVAVSASAAATFVLFSIGLIWVCRKVKRERKRSRNPTVSVYSNERGGSGNGSMKKVSTDPFYLDSIGAALEPPPQAFPFKQNPEKVNSISVSNQNISSSEFDERQGSGKEKVRSESGNNCSAAGEIVSAHDIVESVNYECNKKETDADSSDDESFHSLCGSLSSNLRLSNASAGSLNDTTDILSPKGSIGAHPAPPPPPPPPPPPMPTANMHIFPSHSSSCSTGSISKALTSSTLPCSSSPQNSDSSSSGSNQTPNREFPPPSPNPPKPFVGIPPPPRPPPFSKGNGNTSLKTPPPSQYQQFHYMPLGKDGAPLPKLKPLHWDKVRAAPDQSMVWDKLRSSSFEFDEEMIESLFGYNMQSSMKNDEGKSKSPPPSKQLLDPKRLQNMTILAKALNVTAEQVCDALLQGEGLCLQQLEALVKMAPTKEEEAKLSSYKGDIKELGSTEKFLKAMLNIPFAFLRFEAMLYRETFEDEVFHLRKSFSMLEEACKELRSSRLFLKLLEAVLKTGNRMNVGTIRGGARAFKLDALLKLADVKGADGRTTLLHFVVQEIVRSEGIRVSESIMGKINQKNKTRNSEEREEDYRRMGLDLVSGLSIELCNVKKTATVDLDVLASSVSNLSHGMAKLQQLVGKDLFGDAKGGDFVHKMRFFLGHAEKNIKELREDERRVLVHVREIAEYFHGNVSKDEANPLRIFLIVRDFLGMLDHVCKELRSSKVPSSPNTQAPFR